MSAPAASLAAAAIREIHERHRFFVAWFNGEGPDEALTHALTAFSPDFLRIAPGGETMDVPALAAFLRGKRASAGGRYATAVEDARPIWDDDAAVLVSYLEHQRVDGRENRRRATALFLRSEGAPCGVLWHYLQETQIPHDAGAATVRPSQKDGMR